MNKSDSSIAKVLKQRAQNIYTDGMGKKTNHLLSQLFYCFMIISPFIYLPVM